MSKQLTIKPDFTRLTPDEVNQIKDYFVYSSSDWTDVDERYLYPTRTPIAAEHLPIVRKAYGVLESTGILHPESLSAYALARALNVTSEQAVNPGVRTMYPSEYGVNAGFWFNDPGPFPLRGLGLGHLRYLDTSTEEWKLLPDSDVPDVYPLDVYIPPDVMAKYGIQTYDYVAEANAVRNALKHIAEIRPVVGDINDVYVDASDDVYVAGHTVLEFCFFLDNAPLGNGAVMDLPGGGTTPAVGHVYLEASWHYPRSAGSAYDPDAIFFMLQCQCHVHAERYDDGSLKGPYPNDVGMVVNDDNVEVIANPHGTQLVVNGEAVEVKLLAVKSEFRITTAVEGVVDSYPFLLCVVPSWFDNNPARFTLTQPGLVAQGDYFVQIGERTPSVRFGDPDPSLQPWVAARRALIRRQWLAQNIVNPENDAGAVYTIGEHEYGAEEIARAVVYCDCQIAAVDIHTARTFQPNAVDQYIANARAGVQAQLQSVLPNDPQALVTASNYYTSVLDSAADGLLEDVYLGIFADIDLECGLPDDKYDTRADVDVYKLGVSPFVGAILDAGSRSADTPVFDSRVGMRVFDRPVITWKFNYDKKLPRVIILENSVLIIKQSFGVTTMSLHARFFGGDNVAVAQCVYSSINDVLGIIGVGVLSDYGVPSPNASMAVPIGAAIASVLLGAGTGVIIGALAAGFNPIALAGGALVGGAISLADLLANEHALTNSLIGAYERIDGLVGSFDMVTHAGAGYRAWAPLIADWALSLEQRSSTAVWDFDVPPRYYLINESASVDNLLLLVTGAITSGLLGRAQRTYSKRDLVRTGFVSPAVTSSAAWAPALATAAGSMYAQAKEDEWKADVSEKLTAIGGSVDDLHSSICPLDWQQQIPSTAITLLGVVSSLATLKGAVDGCATEEDLTDTQEKIISKCSNKSQRIYYY